MLSKSIESSTIRLVEVATGKDTHPDNCKYYENRIKNEALVPEHFISNSLKLAAQCVVRETVMHLPRVRVLSVLYYLEDQLYMAYSEKVLGSSLITGRLDGWEYAKRLVNARISYEQEVIWNELSWNDLTHLESWDKCEPPVGSLKCYPEFLKLRTGATRDNFMRKLGMNQVEPAVLNKMNLTEYQILIQQLKNH